MIATMSSVADLKQYLGKTGLWSPHNTGEGIKVKVKVLDVKLAYGRVSLLVSPTSGEGSGWVQASTVEVEGIKTPDPISGINKNWVERKRTKG